MEQRHASARAKTSGRRLLAPIAGDRARTPNAVSVCDVMLSCGAVILSVFTEGLV